MRTLSSAALVLAFGLSTLTGCTGSQPAAETPQGEANSDDQLVAQKSALDAADEVKLDLAVSLMDAGKVSESLTLLDALRAKYPHHPTLLHESGLAHRLGKHPENTVKLLWPYRDSLPADTVALLGSALDEAGRSDEALAVLKTGLVRHPSSGLLYSEIGTTLRGVGRMDEAAGFYGKGIEVDPAAPSNYLNLAAMFSASEAPVMTLFFGEAFRLLEPSSSRSAKIGELMVAVCRESVTREKSDGDSESWHVKLAPSLVVDAASAEAPEVPLPNVLELNFGPGLVLAHKAGLSLATLHDARIAFLQRIRASETLGQLPLYQWLEELEDAGHLEAYDHWLYGPGFAEEYAAWSKAHPEALDGLAQYLSEHPLVTTASR